MIVVTKPKFSLGRIVATPGSLEALEAANQTAWEFISRHARGDWGSVCEEDARLNDESLKDGSRVLSAYELSSGEKVWIITEATGDDGQRSATTVLLPSEY
jgi:hypothetical protein